MIRPRKRVITPPEIYGFRESDGDLDIIVGRGISPEGLEMLSRTNNARHLPYVFISKTDEAGRSRGDGIYVPHDPVDESRRSIIHIRRASVVLDAATFPNEDSYFDGLVFPDLFRGENATEEIFISNGQIDALRKGQENRVRTIREAGVEIGRALVHGSIYDIQPKIDGLASDYRRR